MQPDGAPLLFQQRLVSKISDTLSTLQSTALYQTRHTKTTTNSSLSAFSRISPDQRFFSTKTHHLFIKPTSFTLDFCPYISPFLRNGTPERTSLYFFCLIRLEPSTSANDVFLCGGWIASMHP
ncbi:hypothetical protein CGCF413_v013397 [Colletotrichum fructicola]|nr:hypothetical protein CGCF413_v013397 [Colletotrichum fructicola]